MVKVSPPMGLQRIPRRLRAGMTLMEVLVATAILVFGVVSVLAVIMSAQRTHQRAMDETIAVQVAQSILSEWRAAMDCGQLPPSSDPKFEAVFDQLPKHADYPEYRFAVYAKEINPPPKQKSGEDPIGREYDVEVRVFWQRFGGTRSVRFHTIILQRGS